MKKLKQTLVVLVFKEMESLKQFVMIYVSQHIFLLQVRMYINLKKRKRKKMKKKNVHNLRNKNQVGFSTLVH